jgi:hypothetical protein
MQKLINLGKNIATLTTLLLFTGCVSTSYNKSIAVTKDANGKIIQTVETESVTQPNQSGWPVKFEYMKDVQP